MARKSLSELLGGVTRFGRLTVVGESEPKKYGTRRHRRAFVICDCGTKKTVDCSGLKNGQVKSCGCAIPERARILGCGSRKHGHTAGRAVTTEYRIWSGMKARCLNKNHRRYSSYGGRGITVCPQWAESFEVFLADMGHRPNTDLSIDRIDNDGDYEPANCRWATSSQQNKNRRRLTAVTRGVCPE